MEFIKKTVCRTTPLITITGVTTGNAVITGCTGTCKIIRTGIMGTSTGKIIISGATSACKIILTSYTGITPTYYSNILLNQETKNLGFFDAYPLSGVTGTTNDYDFSNNGFFGNIHTVTGECTSRLLELRKYVISGTTAKKYFSGGTVSKDGVDLTQSVGNQIVYYLGGIKYVDKLTGSTSGSTFSFVSQGYANPNFINKPIYKDPNKENIISNPRISDDVFIVRQELSAFDGNYRLEYIRNLVDLETYAAGNFFNIIKNT